MLPPFSQSETIRLSIKQQFFIIHLLCEKSFYIFYLINNLINQVVFPKKILLFIKRMKMKGVVCIRDICEFIKKKKMKIKSSSRNQFIQGVVVASGKSSTVLKTPLTDWCGAPHHHDLHHHISSCAACSTHCAAIVA